MPEKNPENILGKESQYRARIRHLLRDNKNWVLHKRKLAWLPMVPKTIQHAAVVLDNENTDGTKNGGKVYVRRYGDIKHMVVVDDEGAVRMQFPQEIERFKKDPEIKPTRQEDFDIVTQSPENDALEARLTGVLGRPHVRDEVRPPRETIGAQPPATGSQKDSTTEEHGKQTELSKKLKEIPDKPDTRFAVRMCA